MKALILEVNQKTWSQTKGYKLADVPEPRLENDDDVIIEPIYGGVCGTDKGIWFRKAFSESILEHLEKDKRAHYVMGHELLGRVVEVGAEVKRNGRFHVGQVVSAESHIYCGTCPMCLAGDQHVCINERIIGVTSDGVFAERLKLPERVLWPTILDRIRPEVAAVQEPFGNAVHVCTPFPGADMRGKTVAVLGCGTIGLLAILIARALGARKIIGVEPSAKNQAKAKECGADLVVAPGPGAADEIRAFCDGVGADFALEMSGFSSSVLSAIEGSRRGGHVVLFGLSGGDLMIPRFEDLITAGKHVHAVVGRRVFGTWEITRNLLENRANGIQDAVWRVVLESGQGTILPLAEFTPERFERNLVEHPKTLIAIAKI